MYKCPHTETMVVFQKRTIIVAEEPSMQAGTTKRSVVRCEAAENGTVKHLGLPDSPRCIHYGKEGCRLKNF